jgi:hypothetical protein
MRFIALRSIVSLVALLIALSSQALAQEAPPAEVFAGYSLFRPDGGGSLHGWNASVAIRVNSRMAVVCDFSGHYGSQSLRADLLDDDDFPGDVSIRADSDTSVHSILTGMKFSLAPRASGRLTPFGQILIGASRLGADASVRFGGAALETKFADMGFAVAAGGATASRFA